MGAYVDVYRGRMGKYWCVLARTSLCGWVGVGVRVGVLEAQGTIFPHLSVISVYPQKVS